MKHSFSILLFFMLSLSGYCQSLSDFFDNHNGKQLLGFCAHVTNTYNYGISNIGADNIIVQIHYQDLDLNNRSIVTQIEIGLTDGPFPFNSIRATYDNDWANPFIALGFSCSIIQQLIQNSNRDDYERVRDEMIILFGTDMKHWNGADWALFAMNLAYTDYSASR